MNHQNFRLASIQKPLEKNFIFPLQYVLPTEKKYDENGNQCQNCIDLTKLIQQLQQKLLVSLKKEKKLKKGVERLQNQNREVIENTNKFIKEFEEGVRREEEVKISKKDETICMLMKEIEQMRKQLQSLSHICFEKTQRLKQSEFNKQQVNSELVREINQLKTYIMRQISEKMETGKKSKEQSRKKDLQIYKLKENIGELRQIVREKQKLIKELSQSNDQLRNQIIEKNSTQEMSGNISWIVEKKNLLNDSLAYNQGIKRQNERLKRINKNLDIELQNVIKQSQQIETDLIKTKLERDVLKKSIITRRSDSLKESQGSLERQLGVTKRRFSQNTEVQFQFQQVLEESPRVVKTQMNYGRLRKNFIQAKTKIEMAKR